MNHTSSFLCIAFAGCAFAASARAQDEIKIPRPLPVFVDDKGPADLQSSALPTPPRYGREGASRAKPRPEGAPAATNVSLNFDRVLFSEPGDGRIWARGADYKASFGRENAVFVPFLGSDAPRNFPLTTTLASVHVAGQAVEFAEHGSVSHSGDRVVVERGDVDEVYDLSTKSMEQTFVVERLPVRGDLRLELAIGCELAARQTSDGIVFENDLGGVRYGNVTVIDARGARFETPSKLVDGRIVIDVPAAFIGAARLPLRVDPVFTTFTLSSAVVDEYYSDVAFDLTNNVWCGVYEYAYSTTDHDVYAIIFDGLGNVIGSSLATIDATFDFWTQPRIANNNIADNFLVVASVYPTGGGSSVIKAVTRAAGSIVVGTQNLISGPEVGYKFWADVGGDPHTLGPTYYFVVYQRDYDSSDTDIHARLVNSNGTPQGGTILIDNSGASLDSQPRVSNSNGVPPSSTQEWNVVWMRYDTFNGDNDIRGAQVHWDGVITTASFGIDNNALDDSLPTASSPLDRASGPRPWLVAYQRYNGTDYDLMARVFSNSTLLAIQSLTADEGVSMSEQQLSPDADCDGSQFVVGFTESYLGGPTDYDIYASTFWYADGLLSVSEGHASLDFTSASSFAPKIAAAHSSGQTSGVFAATWTNGTTSLDTFAGLYTTPSDVGVEGLCSGDGSSFNCPCSNNGQFGYGCGNSAVSTGALLAGGGNRHVSSDSLIMTTYDLPGSAPCLFFQGTTPATIPFGDGYLCAGGTIIRLGVKFASGGVANYPGVGDPPVSTTGLVDPNGALRFYQVWYRDAAAFCTPSTFNLTNAIRVVWLP